MVRLCDNGLLLRERLGLGKLLSLALGFLHYCIRMALVGYVAGEKGIKVLLGRFLFDVGCPPAALSKAPQSGVSELLFAASLKSFTAFPAGNRNLSRVELSLASRWDCSNCAADSLRSSVRGGSTCCTMVVGGGGSTTVGVPPPATTCAP